MEREKKPAKEIMIKETAVIKWRNELIEGYFNLSLLEMRLLLALSAHIDKDAPDFETCAASICDLGEFIGVGRDYAGTRIRGLIESLSDKTLRFYWKESDTAKERAFVKIPWFSYIAYLPEAGRVVWRFSDDLAPVLLKVKEAYSRLIAKELMAFKSQYSSRLFMLCTVWEHTGVKKDDAIEKKIFVEDLRRYLGLDKKKSNGKYEKYELYANFSMRVLSPAIEEINALTDYEITATPKKWGRSYNEIIFTIKKQEGKGVIKPFTVPGLPVSAVPLPQQQTTPPQPEPQQQEGDDAEHEGRRGKIPPDVQEWLDGMKKKKPFERTTEKNTEYPVESR